MEDPYREPVLYDLEYAGQTDDIAYYVALARRIRGPVLELGCGNGRITLPIARAGVEIHGLDRSAQMLADLERKRSREPELVRLRIAHGPADFTDFTVAMRYPLVLLPFNALHHCAGTDAVRRMLRGVRGALRPDGVFALDCYLPDPTLYARDPNGRYEERTFADPRTGKSLYSWESGWWDAALRIHHVVYVYEHPDHRQERVHLELHMYEKTELKRLFTEEGFAINAEAMDFAGTPMRPEALKWVLTLRAVNY